MDEYYVHIIMMIQYCRCALIYHLAKESAFKRAHTIAEGLGSAILPTYTSHNMDCPDLTKQAADGKGKFWDIKRCCICEWIPFLHLRTICSFSVNSLILGPILPLLMFVLLTYTPISLLPCCLLTNCALYHIHYIRSYSPLHCIVEEILVRYTM